MKRYLIFILTAFFLFSFAESGCPAGSLQSLTDATKCYSFISSPTEFLNAEQTCVDLNGHLASVGDGFINTFLAGKLFKSEPQSFFR